VNVPPAVLVTATVFPVTLSTNTAAAKVGA